MINNLSSSYIVRMTKLMRGETSSTHGEMRKHTKFWFGNFEGRGQVRGLYHKNVFLKVGLKVSTIFNRVL
jgi:coproporphyrinogen III oxidase